MRNKKNFGCKLQNRDCKSKTIIDIIIKVANYQNHFTAKKNVHVIHTHVCANWVSLSAMLTTRSVSGLRWL